MAVANSNYDEIVTTTLNNRSKKLADNVENNNALLARLRNKGNKRPISGGDKIVQEIAFAENATTQWYSGYEVLDTSPNDEISAAEYNIKQASAAITMSGLEMLKNAGKEKMIDLMQSRIEIGEKSLRNKISTGIYSDGTADGGKQMTGLQALVSDSPTTGTVGGISRADYEFWRNQRWDWSAETGSPTPGATTIQNAMNTLYGRCQRGSDVVDLIVTDEIYWAYYLASLQDRQRFDGDSSLADLGFVTIKYMTADVVLDGGIGGDCPSEHMYFLNTDYLFYRPHSSREFVPIGGERQSTNQDAIVKLLVWAGNMASNGIQFQGVLED